MTITFVTSYYNIYETDHDFYFRLVKFLHLAKSGIHLIVFTNTKYAELIHKELPLIGCHNVHLVISELEFAENDLQKQLPNRLNTSKDTSKFLLLIQNKVQFVKMAMEQNIWPTDTHFAWIDFSLTKVFVDVSQCIQMLHTIDNIMKDKQNSKIILPGCWYDKQDWPLQYYYDDVNWRFCGGFFVGNHQACLEFFKLYQNYYPEFSKTNLTWEVNFWAWLEKEGYFQPEWYFADHDDTMLMNFPLV